MWDVWIDTGGTFTDCLARSPSGEWRRAKVLSTSAVRGVATVGPDARTVRLRLAAGIAGACRGLGIAVVGGGQEATIVEGPDAGGFVGLDREFAIGGPVAVEVRSQEEAPILAARIACGAWGARGELPRMRMRLATTKATNALLERAGARVAFFTNRGLTDLLEIGDQTRPDLFAMDIRKPPPLHEVAAPVIGRLDCQGEEIEALDLADLRRRAAECVERGITSAAVALMHSWKEPRHELLVREALREAGFSHVTCSSDFAAGPGLLTRAQSAVVNASLAPIMGGYIERVRGALTAGSTLHIMTSAGGLVSPEGFAPRDALLSGPAGGVVGALAAARRSGFERIITFDMGGTSTDVSRCDGERSLVHEHAVGSARIVAPAVAVESVAAGGGSICAVVGGRLRVGPASAGAYPGPACYGAGGPLCVTDVNLLLGRIDPAQFPIPLSVEAAREACEALRERVKAELGREMATDELLDLLSELANQAIADAIARVSARQGYEPRDYGLVAFGGAGGQHACAVAELLGISRVIVPAQASLLSAAGVGASRLERHASRVYLRPLAEIGDSLNWEGESLVAEAGRTLERDAPGAKWTRDRVDVMLRVQGHDAALPVPLEGDGADLERAFAAAYVRMYGHEPPPRPLEVVALHASVSVPGAGEAPPVEESEGSESPANVRMRLGKVWVDAPAAARSALQVGQEVRGPALVTEALTSTVVPAGWSAKVDAEGGLILTRGASAGVAAALDTEVIVARLASVASEMGEQLRRTAISVNVKDRADFSCAILDAEGELIANAPHVPVHLGALGECVRSVKRELTLGPRDVAITNHPAFGGSHLPDVTVIAPVFSGDALIAHVAVRAHHAEIGGMAPGSMPADATRLIDEGVVIPPMLLVDKGRDRFEELERLLAAPPHPSRAINENLADVRAALAACSLGRRQIEAMTRASGVDAVREAMESLKRRAEGLLREALRVREGREYAAAMRMDDGWPLQVRGRVENGLLSLDFAGTGPVHPGNFNATTAIVQSVVMYVMRVLIGADIPMNEGLMRAVRLDVPRGMLNPEFGDDPAKGPAVAAGNVETSQRLCNLLVHMLGLGAESQGTMNNLIFGNERFGYYETIGGGAGAGPEFAGASAVHTHMTNTRITDPEVLEHRYPVRLERFEIRRGSGGAGRWQGGDGMVRAIRMLEGVRVSVIGQKRVEGPRGGEGGGSGAAGVVKVIRMDGSEETLAPAVSVLMEAGEVIEVKTPGGGGWGSQRLV